MNVFGDIEIIDGDVSAKDQNENPANVSLTSPIDMQNNNIYNIGNLESQESGGAPALAWEKSKTKTDAYGGARIECRAGEVLTDVTCFSDARPGGSDAEGDHIRSCGNRLRGSASKGGAHAGVSGTCVPVKGAKLKVFNNQNRSDTFQIPQGTSTVSYKIYGGSGGNNGGKGGYMKGSIPVDGGGKLEIYVGQNGETGVEPDNPRGGTPGPGGRGGCVPFNGVTCGGDGGDGGLQGLFNAPD
nr:MAG: hypothetical protein J07AB56_06340 [Candidatus Nanosalinarum sp. J07AB56]